MVCDLSQTFLAAASNSDNRAGDDQVSAQEKFNFYDLVVIMKYRAKTLWKSIPGNEGLALFFDPEVAEKRADVKNKAAGALISFIPSNRPKVL